MIASLHRRLPRLGRWPRLLLAATCLLLAAGTSLEAKSERHRPAHSVPVIVAAHDLPAGHALTRHDLAISRWPPALCPAGTRHNPKALIGRRTAGPIAGHEVLLGTRLVNAHLTDGLDPRLVAAPAKLDDPHALDLVRAGDRVDLLATARAPDLPDAIEPTPQTSTLAANALVLAALPATDDVGAELILAVERATALRITRDSAGYVFTAVVVPP